MALRKDRPEPEAPADEIRHRIAAAARDLFADQGYERTTVDAIAERAGVGRRTFFRYFPSKDDVLFPDHARIVRLTAAHLAALDDVPPVRAVCSGARHVLRHYLADPVGAVQRYRLAGSVPALKAREIASVSEYVRLFSRYLRERLGSAQGSGSTAMSWRPRRSPPTTRCCGTGCAAGASATRCPRSTGRSRG